MRQDVAIKKLYIFKFVKVAPKLLLMKICLQWNNWAYISTFTEYINLLMVFKSITLHSWKIFLVNLASVNHLKFLLFFQPTKELIKEIAVLELEIVYLERYLLSLYRNTFYEQMPSVSTMDGRLSSAMVTHKEISAEAPGQDIMPEKEKSVTQSGNHISQNSLRNRLKECNDNWEPEKLLDSSIHRSHSSLSQRSACSFRTSPPKESLNKAVDSYHSLPLSMLEVILHEKFNLRPKVISLLLNRSNTYGRCLWK